MPYDYAPRLALLARNRRRRHVLFTVCMLMLPALSFQAARGIADAPLSIAVQHAQSNADAR